MKSVPRVISVVAVALTLAAGVALADGPSSSPTVVQSTSYASQGVLAAIAAASSTSVAPSVPAPEPEVTPTVAATPSPPPDGSAVVAADTSDQCDQISSQAASITATFDALEQHLRSVIPAGRVDAIVAVLDGTRSRTIANLDAAAGRCQATIPGPTTTPIPASVAVLCADLPARQAEINDQFDAAEAQLTATITGSELTAAIASLEVARTQTNAGLDVGIAACASVPPSTPTTAPNVTTTIGAASCAEIRADQTAFNAELDAAQGQLQAVLADGSPELTTALASLEEQRAAGNARFDEALTHC